MIMEVEVEWPLMTFVPEVSGVVSTLPSSPITWNLETGSKVKVPGPLAERSYRDDTVEELRSIGVAGAASGSKTSPSCSTVTLLPIWMTTQSFSES